MKKIHDAYAVFLFLLVLFTAGLMSCTDDSVGIFYSLEVEEKAADNSLPNEVRITGNILRADVAGAFNRYYVGAGSVFYRDATSDTATWVKIKSPITGGIVSGIAKLGSDATTQIFVSVSNGSSSGLYRLDPDTQYSTFLSENIYSEKQVTRLFALNDRLFASVGTILDDDYELLVYDGTELVSTGITSYRIVAGTYDTAASTYWFAGEADIFSKNTETGWDVVADKLDPTGGGLDGRTYLTDIFADPYSPGTLYVCTEDGYVIRSTDSGATWTSSGDFSENFYCIARVGDASDGFIVLGANYDGIVELSDDLSTYASPGGNFSYLPDLVDSTIIRIFADGKILFTGSTTNGLWRGDYSSDLTSPVWSQE